MPRLVIAVLLTLLAVPAADAACLSRDRSSNCFEPRGNSYLSPPRQRLFSMPQADPRIAPAPLAEGRTGPGQMGRQSRGPFPTVNGRVLRHPGVAPCAGLSCNRQQRYFGPGCTSPRCT